MEELIFTGGYKSFSLNVRFDLSGKGPADAAAALAFISERIEPHAFRFSGIDTAAVERFAKAGGRGVGAVRAFFEERAPGAIKDALSRAVPVPELMPAAESCLFNSLLRSAGVPFKADPAGAKPSEHGKEDFIGFIGNYGGWVAIKKLSLEKVRDYEVSGILSGINHTIVNKAFDFAGMRRNDDEIGAAVKGKRRSYGNVAPLLRELEPKLDGTRSDGYVVCKALEGLGYKPYASPEMLTSAHPDIKPPKVKGRKPKG
jgi:hypothetical protein